ncbi:hypothetical protein LSH36_97g07023 [Paralvinella palmiformis]|uniref:SAP domain-containing protein n=1 Tax=Paralvinella palmiformis TaxID=53620 RepID=A0AAD9K0Y8_9ANNE|nr:hypothetical protein LSH36_97g07023 [Paralvinella palmiformis]
MMSEFGGMTLGELRDELRKRHAKLSGRKRELVERDNTRTTPPPLTGEQYGRITVTSDFGNFGLVTSPVGSIWL